MDKAIAARPIDNRWAFRDHFGSKMGGVTSDFVSHFAEFRRPCVHLSVGSGAQCVFEVGFINAGKANPVLLHIEGSINLDFSAMLRDHDASLKE